jgi:hypothetical protein
MDRLEILQEPTLQQPSTTRPSSVAPSDNQTNVDRVSIFRDLLADFFENGSDFPSSPIQAEVLEWLANEDPTNLVPLEGTTDPYVYLERLVFALFYAATGGDDWPNNNNNLWLSQLEVSAWRGLSCNSINLSVDTLNVGKYTMYLYCSAVPNRFGSFRRASSS